MPLICWVLMACWVYHMRMNKEALEEIQIKIAFLERANNDLSEAVYRQDREIRSLGEQLRLLTERLQSAQTLDRARDPVEERPPHY
jgi:uncharacterized coiled-coil protein SlyX